MMKKIVLGFALSICTFTVSAQWDTDPASANNPVITAEGNQAQKLIVSDGANGAIVIAETYNEFAVEYNITAQKINSNGVIQWGATNAPKVIYSKPGETEDDYLYGAISDGSGGAYVVWFTEVITASNDTISDNYIQHINSSGNILWATTGLKVNSNVAGRSSGQVSLCPDGSGGLVVVWDESDFNEATQLTTFSQVYAQRYNSAGAKQWGTNGVQVCTANGLRGGASAINDGSNNYIIYFGDTRNSNHYLGPDGEVFDNLDIYAQKLNSSGALQWAAAGVAVTSAVLNQVPAGGFGSSTNSGVVADGSGGSVVLINQYALDNGEKNKFLAQKLNSSGAKQWAANGVTVCNIDSTKFLLKTFSDGAGGMVTAWSDFRTPPPLGSFFATPEIYAQRIVSGGTANWTADGVNASGAGQTTDFYNADATDDGSGNYIFTWSNQDFFSGTSSVVARKLNNSGAQQWGASPKPVCTNPDAIGIFASIIKSNNGSAIIAWLDQRNNDGISQNGADIFAAKITSDGSLGGGGVVTPVTYTFTGTGNWNTAGNWSNNTIPPSTLPSGSTIVINPSSGSCVLNVSQTISAGATFTLMAGKNLVIQGNLNITQ